MKENVIADKSFNFAVRITRLHLFLKEEKKEFELSKQILKSGTSIGANVAESQDAQSKLDFISKLSIALKEARETLYWLRLLKATDFINETIFNSLYNDCEELIRLLVSIIKNSRGIEN